jgi:hypothetical protein
MVIQACFGYRGEPISNWTTRRCSWNGTTGSPHRPASWPGKCRQRGRPRSRCVRPFHQREAGSGSRPQYRRVPLHFDPQSAPFATAPATSPAASLPFDPGFRFGGIGVESNRQLPLGTSLRRAPPHLPLRLPTEGKLSEWQRSCRPAQPGRRASISSVLPWRPRPVSKSDPE